MGVAWLRWSGGGEVEGLVYNVESMIHIEYTIHLQYTQVLAH